jgi:hypothetical protein
MKITNIQTFQVKDGYIDLPTKPGLGIEVNVSDNCRQFPPTVPWAFAQFFAARPLAWRRW